MSPLDAFWHVANFFLPAWALAALLAVAIKLLWRQQARAQRWLRLWTWGGAGGTAAALAAIALTGRDGSMTGYALLLLGVALPQWWLLSFRR